ncbi:MAG: putative CAMK family protein kinase, partial [Streblomastix strix]
MVIQLGLNCQPYFQLVNMDYEDILRRNMLVPLHPLGRGSFGCVYLVYHHKQKIVATKVIHIYLFDKGEIDAQIELLKIKKMNIFVMKYVGYMTEGQYPILLMEYANLNTLNIIAQQPQITLPTCTLRALMKQILVGIQSFHSAGLVHSDIKLDNILLHSPPGSGRVHIKISDFGLAKKVDLMSKQIRIAGTLLYMAPESLLHQANPTEKIDIYATGIVFYKLITHNYPVNINNIN